MKNYERIIIMAALLFIGIGSEVVVSWSDNKHHDRNITQRGGLCDEQRMLAEGH